MHNKACLAAATLLRQGKGEMIVRQRIEDAGTTGGMTESEAKLFASSVMLQVENMTKFEGGLQKAIDKLSLTVNHVHDNTFNIHIHLAAKQARKKYQPKAITKLCWRLIHEPQATFNDRLIFSWLWKFGCFNNKRIKEGRKPKPATVARLRRATGMRPETIKGSIRHLMGLGLIDGDLTPQASDQRVLKTSENRGKYRMLRIKREWGDIGPLRVFRAIKESDSIKGNKPLGTGLVGRIPRRTYFRWMSKIEK